jgi:hypothetical protein
MKKIVFLSLVIALIIGSCTQQEVKSPVEGAWKIVSFNMPSMNMTFPGQVQGEQIKIWTKEYVAFVGQYKVDTTVTANYGWGTYTLNGNKYEEKVVLHADKPSIGKTIRILLDIRNDTLTQRYPADENWKLQEGYSTEKYVRVE